MNRDPISPKQEHDTQIHGARRKSINANGVFGCTVVAAGHKELHIIAHQAHWFTSSRVGATLISGKCIDVDLLILVLFFGCHVFLLMQIPLLFRTTWQEFTYCRYKDNVIII